MFWCSRLSTLATDFTGHRNPTTFRKCACKCGVSGCHKSHHSLLHINAEAPSAKKLKTIVSTAWCVTCIHAHLNHEPKFSKKDIETSLPSVLAKIKVNKKEKIIFVGFDSFSQKTFLTKDIADELKIPITRREVLNIGGFGDFNY